MKVIFKNICTYGLMLMAGLCLAEQALAQEGNPKLEQAVEIQDVQIIGEPVKGNTFEVLVRYKSSVTNVGRVAVRAAEHIKFSGRSLQQKVLSVSQNFIKGNIRSTLFCHLQHL